ncbi:unnamed protein product [Clavelina lepadiformis]|uniref:Nab N-terminal domain-containing protein n=1 Tax=Clavelina lepadiformis TaxID=159417 RepID=A0ABP0FEY7_CLALP
MEQGNIFSSQPSNTDELELYKVLQRANLLEYYDIFISVGGDDVGQLCEAEEDEFLEIMSLVGMVCKPMHVRRFQKALQEWAMAPQIFEKSPSVDHNQNFMFEVQKEPTDLSMRTLAGDRQQDTQVSEKNFEHDLVDYEERMSTDVEAVDSLILDEKQ